MRVKVRSQRPAHSARGNLPSGPFRRSVSRRRQLAVFERLEPRHMLSGDAADLFHTAFLSDSGAQPFASSTPSGLTPQQIRQAYGFDQVAFGGVTGDGSGQTIAIIDPYDSPTIASDLHAFDAQFGLPDPPRFVRVAQDGSTNYPMTDPNAGHSPVTWELETALDVEWAHAPAPRANLLLVEADSTSPSDLLTAAVNYARNQPGVSVVSMSFGRSEIPAEVSYDSLFATPSGHNGVTFLAATGDSGQPAAYPAYSPNVIAVGGTALSVDDAGNYLGETGWSGSGGGISTVEPQPSFQNPTVEQFSTTQRTAPDVSFNAASGVAVYDSWDFGTSTPWMSVGGTSLACPSWGALIAIADQARVAAGMTTLDGSAQTLPALYAMPSADFNDITTGNNGFNAGPGYDLVTGRGSPKVPLVVSDLVGGVASSVPAAGSSVSTPPTDFAITFASAYDPSSIQVGDFSVNGQTPNSFTLSSATTVTFHFNATPVGAQGLQMMSIPAGAITWLSNGAPLTAYSASFRYDVLPISVTSMTPASGSTVTLPLATVILHFNEAYDPSTISTSNLSLNQGSVSSYTLVDVQTVSYQLAGITSRRNIDGRHGIRSRHRHVWKSRSGLCRQSDSELRRNALSDAAGVGPSRRLAHLSKQHLRHDCVRQHRYVFAAGRGGADHNDPGYDPQRPADPTCLDRSGRLGVGVRAVARGASRAPIDCDRHDGDVCLFGERSRGDDRKLYHPGRPQCGIVERHC